jgi:hypothetical protein
MHVRRSQKAWIGVLLVLFLAGVAAGRRYQADPDRIYSAAEKAYQSGRYVAADAELERLARLRPPTSLDHYLRAQVDVGLKRDQDAKHGLESERRPSRLAEIRRG